LYFSDHATVSLAVVARLHSKRMGASPATRSRTRLAVDNVIAWRRFQNACALHDRMPVEPTPPFSARRSGEDDSKEPTLGQPTSEQLTMALNALTEVLRQLLDAANDSPVAHRV
jgi:hypothetical protein